MIKALIITAAMAKNYPTAKIYEWDGVADDSKDSKTNGWEMKGNFYVIRAYANAPLKFGVALGLSPPADWVLTTEQVT